jgi:exonuclease III
LPAKIDKLKLLISELRDKHIELDFIMLCETFLSDAISHQFNIPGYNLVCINRSNKTRGGVAIYVNSKFNFKKRDDLAINIHGTFESIFIEIQSDKFKAVGGEIYRVPNTSSKHHKNV